MLMFVVLLASYAINAMDRQVFPLVTPDVRKAFGFSLADAGLLSTVFTLGMAISGLPTGWLLAHTSRKTVMQVGIAIFSAGTALTVLSGGFVSMFVYRAATGIGEAMQLTSLLTIAASCFARHSATAMGSVNFSYGVGAVIGPVLGARLLVHYQSWRVPLVVFGLIGFVAIAVIAITVSPWFTETQGRADSRAGEGGAASLANRNTILLTVICFITGLMVYGYLGMYPTFLREYLHFSPRDAGMVMSMYGIGALASILCGWLGDRFSPRIVLAIAFLGTAQVGYLFFHEIRSVTGQALLSLFWGMLASGTLVVNLGAYHVRAVRGGLANQATGLFVTSFYGSAVVAGYTIGWIANRTSWVVAGEIQFCLGAIVALALVLALRPGDMLPVRSSANCLATAKPWPKQDPARWH
jgi:MFS family permease